MIRISRKYLFAALAAAILFSLIGLDTAKIYFSDELFYINSGIHMVETGDWLVPMHNDAVRFQKPLIYYWLVAVSYEIFGISVAAARLPSVVSMLGLAWVVWAIARLLFDSERTAFYSVLVLLSLPMVIWYGRTSMTDTTLMFFIAVSLYLALRGEMIEEHRRLSFFGSFVFMGFGAMTKGPPGVIFPMLSFVLYVLIARKNKKVLLRYFHPLNLFILLAMTIPWPIYMYRKFGQDYYAMVVQESVTRRIGFSAFKIFKAFFYYIGTLLRYFAPHIFVVIIAFVFGGGKLREAWRERRHAVVALLFPIAIVFVTYTFFVFDLRSRYLLTAAPFIAILAGHAISKYEETGTGSFPVKAFFWLFMFFEGFLIITLAAIVWVTSQVSYFSPVPSAVCLVVILIGTIATVPFYRKGHFRGFVMSTVLTALATINLMVGVMGPSVSIAPTANLVAHSSVEIKDSDKVLGFKLTDNETALLNISVKRTVRNIRRRRSKEYSEISNPVKGTFVVLKKKQFDKFSKKLKKRYEVVSESFKLYKLDASGFLRSVIDGDIEGFIDTKKLHYVLIHFK